MVKDYRPMADDNQLMADCEKTSRLIGFADDRLTSNILVDLANNHVKKLRLDLHTMLIYCYYRLILS